MSTDVSALRNRAYLWLAGLTLPVRRPVFWVLWHAAWLVGRNRVNGFGPLFRRLLGTPRGRLPDLERRFSYAQQFAFFEVMTFKSRPTQGLISDIKHVHVSNGEALDRLAKDRRSVIFAPLHMGANIFAMISLLYVHFRGRKLLILRKDPNEEDTLIYERARDIGTEVKFMFVDDKTSFVEALRFGRRDAVVICFCDLPAHFGSPADVELLGQPGQLAMGIEALSRALDAPIVPLTTYSEVWREVAEVGTPFEVGPGSPGERARVARRIADHVTRSIHKAPDQWELWWMIDKYLDAYRDAEHEAEATSPLPRGRHRYDISLA